MKNPRTLRYGLVTATVFAVALSALMLVPTTAQAAWKKTLDAVMQVESAKFVTMWKNEDGSDGHMTLWCDANRARKETSDGSLLVFRDNKVAQVETTGPISDPDYIGSFNPNDFLVQKMTELFIRQNPALRGTETWNGQKLTVYTSSNHSSREDFYIDPITNLPVRVVFFDLVDGEWKWRSENRYSFNVKLSDDLFQFPKGVPVHPSRSGPDRGTVID